MELLILIIALILAGAWYAISRVLPYIILRPYRQRNDATPAAYGLAFEAVPLVGDGGVALDGVFLPCPTRARATLIVLHGIGSCKEVYYPILPDILTLGYNILLWDQRAHGKSGGEFTTFGAREKLDVRAGVDWLAARTPGLPTGIYGNSMGGAVALQSLATDERLRFGLIESTFTDLPTITQAYGYRLSGLPLPKFLTDLVLWRAGLIAGFKPFDIRPVEAAVAITQPVQLIHGDADGNIDVGHVHRLYAALGSADKRLHVVAGGDHADLYSVGGGEINIFTVYRAVFFGFLRDMVGKSTCEINIFTV